MSLAARCLKETTVVSLWRVACATSSKKTNFTGNWANARKMGTNYCCISIEL
jgi:hypothetical protein